MTTTNLAWNDGDVARLRALYANNLSMSAIAEAMGVSRSAVIGKVHRLKLPLRGHPGPTAHRQHGNKGQPKAKGIVARAERRFTDIHRVPHHEASPLPISDEGVDVTSLLGLLDLRDDNCRWPVGDPLLAGFGFCGKPVKEGSSWCPDHHARVFVKGSAYGGRTD